MKAKYVCNGSMKYCGKGTANAHTMTFKQSKIKFCTSWLNSSLERRSSVIIHELSHNFGTDDIEYERKKIKFVEWWNNAETYEMWMDHDKFCVPGVPGCL